MKMLKQIGQILGVVTFVFCGAMLVNAVADSESSFGRLDKGASYTFNKAYKYNYYSGEVKPTQYGTSMTWNLYKQENNNYTWKKTYNFTGMQLNKGYSTGSYNYGAGNAKQIFTAGNDFYGNIQAQNNN